MWPYLQPRYLQMNYIRKLRWDHPDLGCTLNPMWLDILQEEGEGDLRHRQDSGKMTLWRQDSNWGCAPTSQGMPRVIRSWKGKEGGFLPQTLQAAQPYQYLNFRLPASRTMRGYFLLFKPPSLWLLIMTTQELNKLFLSLLVLSSERHFWSFLRLSADVKGPLFCDLESSTVPWHDYYN